jgi:hypothetical protein
MPVRKAIIGEGDLGPLDRWRRIPVQDAAALLSIHVDTFEAHFGHLIEKVGPRLRRVELGRVLDLARGVELRA